MTERLARIILNTVPNVGAAKVSALINAFGSLSAAANVSANAIVESCNGIGETTAQHIHQALHSDIAEREEAKAASCHVTILTELDEAWPSCLNQLDSPPLCLYCAGDIRLLKDPQIAIVGTRQASLYGKDQAQRIARYLATVGLHITSGLAEGIDTAAHQGALQSEGHKGKTIAVIGAALDCLYPQSNKPLAREIVQKGGLVLCEYPFGRYANTQTFPRRNRLIAALSQGILVVETAFHGGTMGTVKYGVNLGRPIFAIPGRLEWPSFYGNHKLIHEGIARLIYSPEHIINSIQDTLAMGLTSTKDQPFFLADNTPKSTLPFGLNEQETLVWEALDLDGISLDEIAERTQLPMGQLMSITTALQIRKKIRLLPGGRYARTK